MLETLPYESLESLREDVVKRCIIDRAVGHVGTDSAIQEAPLRTAQVAGLRVRDVNDDEVAQTHE